MEFFNLKEINKSIININITITLNIININYKVIVLILFLLLINFINIKMSTIINFYFFNKIKLKSKENY